MSEPRHRVDFSLSVSSLLSLTLLIAFAFGFVFAVGGVSSRVMQSYHGLHHSAYVTQIANGIVAPSNPSSLEMPANFYWAWHALLAQGVQLFDVTSFEMSLWSNAFGLAGFLYGLWLAMGGITRRPWLRLAACTIPFFILNPLGLIQFAARLAGVWIPELVSGTPVAEATLFDHLIGIARHHSALQMSDHNLAQLFPRLGLFGDAGLSDRAGHLLNKFLNFNSFPLALGFFAGAQWMLLSWRGQPFVRAAALGAIVFCMAIVSPLPAAAFGVTVAAYAFVEVLPSWTRRSTSQESDSGEFFSAAAPIIGCGVGVLLALPVVLPISSAYGGTFAVLTPSTGLFGHAVALGWALIPTMIVLGAAFVVRAHLDGAARVHALSALGYGIAAIVINAPQEDPNEYKFVLLAAFPASLLSMSVGRVAATRLGERGFSMRRLAFAATLAIATMGSVAIAVVTLLYVASPWAAMEPFRFEGSTVMLSGSTDRRTLDLDAAFAWLRTATPKTAYVFAEPASKNEDLLPALTGRRVVAQLPSPFTQSIEHHEQLLEINRDVMRRLPNADLRELKSLPIAAGTLDFYALVEKMPRMSAAEAGASSRAATLEYSNATFAIYHLGQFAW